MDCVHHVSGLTPNPSPGRGAFLPLARRPPLSVRERATALSDPTRGAAAPSRAAGLPAHPPGQAGRQAGTGLATPGGFDTARPRSNYTERQWYDRYRAGPGSHLIDKEQRCARSS
ncbi:hypothetical protein FRACA_20121 [Frankia canadensis]|uniref:Uncharacterized protein n=1 Tax=Frankia canadensis TaxID=1836972 RepID=A0A2I2KPY3_9ACTN|nr:hypothetical protein FRACA_20121 [Frankia canadensis]SOU55015.1 hypothetical protein FRACA_20121 [Frankia canadensis]